MQIVDCIQGTEAWHQARAGIVTASEFSTVLAKGRGGGESKTRRTYLLKLAGERLTGFPAESYSNGHMERGKVMEDEARRFYEFLTDAELQQVGFIRNGDKGCSPDSLISTDGVLEIKTALPHLLIDMLLKDEFPPDHRAQTQGQLWVAEREWVDLIVFWPNLPPLVKRAYRDPGYIIQLSDAVDQFNEELESVVEKIRSYGIERATASGGSA